MSRHFSRLVFAIRMLVAATTQDSVEEVEEVEEMAEAAEAAEAEAGRSRPFFVNHQLSQI